MRVVGALLIAISIAPLVALADDAPPPPIPGTSLTGTTDVVHGGRGRAPEHTWRREYLKSPDDQPWTDPAGVTIIDEERSTSIGVTKGPLVDGRKVLARGRHGEVVAEAGRVWTRGHVGAGIVGKNIAGRAHFDLAATGVGIFAGSGGYGIGDPRKMTYAHAGGFAVAFAGAEANGDVYARAGVKGVAAKARVGGFAGVKTVGMALTGGTLCGVSVNGRGAVSGQAGIGGDLSGTFRFDWATMSASVGADVSATLGLGAGIGGDVEISLEGLVRDPRGAARCAGDLVEVAVAKIRDFCPWCPSSTAGGGSAVARASATARDPGTTSPPTTAPAAGAGMARH